MEVMPAVCENVSLSLAPTEIEPFREMLRQQILGDQELLRDAVAGREDPEIRLQVYDRLVLTRRLSESVGLSEERLDRRRSPSRADDPDHLRVPISSVWITLGLLLSTLAVYTVDRFLYVGIASLFLPVIAFVTLRHGRRAGFVTTLASMALYAATYPLRADHQVIRPACTFAAFLLANWLVRRDLF